MCQNQPPVTARDAKEHEASPFSTPSTSSSSSTDGIPNVASAVQDLKRRQEGVYLNSGGSPLFPKRKDFPELSITILDRVIDVDVRNCVIILQDHSKAENSLNSLALRLQKALPESVFILLRALQSTTSSENATNDVLAEGNGLNTVFLKQSRTILVDVIKNGLIAKCHFSPRDIIILGHCRGGTAALAAMSLWEETEFGGVISIGGAMPPFTSDTLTSKAKTPALILSGELGNVNDTALKKIREHFIYVESDIRRSSNDGIPKAEDMGILLDFFAHRLKAEEWTKQAVISFDGGGIRGYGSLLILRALMDKIGEEEKRLDSTVKSSFAPYDFKPRPTNISVGLDDTEVDGVIATATQGLPNSSLFLPCHYFTYAAGSSTGGLISIMLSRFRMSVDDCIKEYKTLGARVFGNPRPLAIGAVLWHKFNRRTLEAAIKDVTQRYSELGDFGGLYAMDEMGEDVCRTMVLAYEKSTGVESPYLFRTYRTPQGSKSRGYCGTTATGGDAAALPVWQVGRATSAAPTYFPPIEIDRGNRPGSMTFKDGGFGSNNPSEHAYLEVINNHGGTSLTMGPLVSIGTGNKRIDIFSNRKGNFSNAVATLKAVTKLPSRTEGAHLRMERLSRHDNKERFPYFRFDGGERLGEIAMDEWKSHRLTRLTGKDNEPGCKTLEKMYVAAAAYLTEPKVQRDLTECARILVRRRRLRARNSSEWDRYASFSYYDCNVKGCTSPRCNKAQEFREHLQKLHYRIADREMEQRVQECRCVYWKYRPGPT